MIGNQPFHILLVEDEIADAQLTIMGLRDAKVPSQVHHVLTGAAMLEFLFESEIASSSLPRPDLILLDLNMPEMNGREVLKKVKEHFSFRDIPLIVLSTSDDPRTIQYCYQNGANSYICKPINVSENFWAMKIMVEYWAAVASAPRHQRKRQG